MIFKILYQGELKSKGCPLNFKVNGVINRILGPCNKWHGEYSPYCVSPMRNFVFNHETKEFTYSGDLYFYVSSPNPVFIKEFLEGLVAFEKKKEELSILSLEYNGFELDEFVLDDDYDIIRTLGPIRLTNDMRFVTYQDEGFIEILTAKCKSKLMLGGFSQEDVDSLTLELFNIPTSSIVHTNIRYAKNIASKVMLVVHAPKEVRKALYEVGFGNCTGMGFGFITIANKYKNRYEAISAEKQKS